MRTASLFVFVSALSSNTALALSASRSSVTLEVDQTLTLLDEDLSYSGDTSSSSSSGECWSTTVCAFYYTTAQSCQEQQVEAMSAYLDGDMDDETMAEHLENWNAPGGCNEITQDWREHCGGGTTTFFHTAGGC